ncbi:replication-relaxation family protein [Paenibacillus cisolokensis]|uniref:replication-relaxation family protein n=1 Tax=Paenibacillus cisolokensis TaxID=1658519 RepID=UPI003D266A36
MIARDRAIISDLERFRCLTRDDVAELHFAGLRDPVKAANAALLRLRRDGRIAVSRARRKYIYFPVPGIKKDSAKIDHFLAIVDFYRQLRRIEEPRRFEVEPKYGKGRPEPDVFTIWKGVPWFVEIQRTVYSDKVMSQKLDRYEAYFHSGEWEREPWQPREKKYFPYVWILGAVNYRVHGRSFRILQTKVEDVCKM